jgi:hypothetical protein
MSLEALWYEVSPYLYFLVGLVAVLFSTSTSGFLFSAILIAIAVTLLCLRRIYRSPASEHLRKYARPGQRRRNLPFGRV